jgi:CBS domain-containing protein
MSNSASYSPFEIGASRQGVFTVKPNTTIEEALILASEYLCCAAATAHEAADNSTSEFRPLARSVMHQIAAARVLVEAAVVRMEGCRGDMTAGMLIRANNTIKTLLSLVGARNL